MENDNLLKIIKECDSKFDNSIPILYEAYFLKIYVAFEKYLGDIFTLYCTGKESSKGYCPKLKLKFVDESQLKAIINGGDSNKYIDYLKIISTLSEYIFIKNPFEILTTYSNYPEYINQMKCIRNYIAHESDNARSKYKSTCLKNNDFIPPCDFLKSIHKGIAISNYTLYIKKIIEISELLIDPPEDLR